MSILIDDLIQEIDDTKAYRRIDHTYRIAKPCEFYGLYTIMKRIRDAFRVLIGKSQAYHYYEDEYEI